ncbi:MAG: beta-galactosidase trimerization domain-containing protein, partial [Victivallaceae bacterium]|nr:beta-galactosidase trimerization domain-containing protein [Victivallaceae bacterium]
LRNVLRYCGLYAGGKGCHVGNEQVRTFWPPKSIRGAFFGTYGYQLQYEPRSRHVPWWILFHKMNTYLFWTSWHCMGAAFSPALTPAPHFMWLHEEINKIKGGIDKAVLNSERENYKIAVHYSQLSIHLDTITRASKLSKIDIAQQSFLTLLEDIGLQYDYIASTDIENGRLNKFKVLILPYSQALSDAEAKAVKEFVKNGGTLISDLRPGIVDSSCKYSSALFSLLGIDRTGNKAKVFTPIETTEGCLVTASGKSSGFESKAEKNITVTTGTARGKLNGVPAVIVNTYGSGKSVYLNFALDNYLVQRQKAGGGSLRKLFFDILTEAGIEQPVKIKYSGSVYEPLETVLFKNGNITYAGFLKNPDFKNSETVKILLPEKLHIYDMIRHKYSGFAAEMALTFKPGDFKLFALCPSQPAAPAVTINAAEFRQGDNVIFEINTDSSSNTSICIDFIDPDGNRIEHYRKKILVRNGCYKGDFRLAFNEKPGNWQLIFTDVITGKKVKKGFTVK